MVLQEKKIKGNEPIERTQIENKEKHDKRMEFNK